MNKKIRKIIAREFLLLLVLIVLGSLIVLSVFPYNAYQRNQVVNLNSEIGLKEKQTNSLHKTVNEKIKNQEWFFVKVSSEFDIANSEYSELKTLWPLLQRIAENDSTAYRWNNKWENSLIEFHKSIGFKNPEELESFIEQNSVYSKDSIDLKKSNEIRIEIKGLNTRKSDLKRKIFTESDKENMAIGIGIILFGILFLSRYLFYAIKWSIKTLKE